MAHGSKSFVTCPACPAHISTNTADVHIIEDRLSGSCESGIPNQWCDLSDEVSGVPFDVETVLMPFSTKTAITKGSMQAIFKFRREERGWCVHTLVYAAIPRSAGAAPGA
jgi:hypothetical protein